MKHIWIPLIFVCLVGCSVFKSADLKNFGGNSSVSIKPDGTVDITNAQPDNPNTTARQTITVGPEYSLVITQETGGAYENKLGSIQAKLKGVFAMARMYHFAAIACFIVGMIIRMTSIPYLSNKVGYGFAGTGIGLFVLGALMPKMGTYVLYAACLATVAGAWYIYHKYILNKEPPMKVETVVNNDIL